MSSLARVPCTIVTGFLGSGKTTLIRHVLANANGRRLAVIVNEFGDEGIDGEILKGCGDASCPEENIVELANGCLCCTVADEFVPALDEILAMEPPVEHIVIETSGLALPKPLVQAFRWPAIKSRVTVDGVVAVVDGAALADGQVSADLVDDDGEPPPIGVGEHVADQRRLARTQKAGDDGAGNASKRSHSVSSVKSTGGTRAISPRFKMSGRPRQGSTPSCAPARSRAPSISASASRSGSNPPNM